MSSVADLYIELAEQFNLTQGCMGKFCGLEPKTVEAMYFIARSVYEQEQYAEAESMFKVLCLMDHHDMRFWLGLGASRQLLGRYEDAISAYLYAVYHLGEEPILYFYIAQCHGSLGQTMAAHENLNQVIRRASDGNLLKRAQALLNELPDQERRN